MDTNGLISVIETTEKIYVKVVEWNLCVSLLNAANRKKQAGSGESTAYFCSVVPCGFRAFVGGYPESFNSESRSVSK